MTLWSDRAASWGLASCLWMWRLEGTTDLLTPRPQAAPYLPLAQLLNLGGVQAPPRKDRSRGAQLACSSCRNHPAAAIQVSGPFVKRSSEVPYPPSPKPGGPGARPVLPPREAPAALPRPLSLQPAALFSFGFRCVISGAMKQMQSGISGLTEHPPQPHPSVLFGPLLPGGPPGFPNPDPSRVLPPLPIPAQSLPLVV